MGHPIDPVCRPLLSVCLGRCKDLALTTAVAALIEKGAIQGTGSSNQPLGLLNLPDALSQTFAAATPTSDELASMLEKLGDAKADLSKVVFLMHPSTAADLMKTRVDASSGALVLNGFEIHGLPVFVSSNVTEDKVIAMDPSYSRIVYFAAPQVVVDPFRGHLRCHARSGFERDGLRLHQSKLCCGGFCLTAGSKAHHGERTEFALPTGGRC